MLVVSLATIAVFSTCAAVAVVDDAAPVDVNPYQSKSLLSPIVPQVVQPDSKMFPQAGSALFPPVRTHLPANTQIVGAKQTNKWWLNWAVDHPSALTLPIFSMPYVLKWYAKYGGQSVGTSSPFSEIYGLSISHGKQELKYDTMDTTLVREYYVPFIQEFAIGAAEGLESAPSIIEEGLFGCHIQLRRPGFTGNITFPLYSGMVYVSALYSGTITPAIYAVNGSSVLSVVKESPGIWKFVNSRNVEFRVYAIETTGAPSASVDFTVTNGKAVMSSAFKGWVRVAHVQEARDRKALDAYSTSILTNLELEAEVGGVVRYKFTSEGTGDLLHYAYYHHMKYIPNATKPNMSQSQGPTKGNMTAVVGKVWEMKFDITEEYNLSFFPHRDPPVNERGFLREAALQDLEYYIKNWTGEVLRDTYYFSGKQFQKVGLLCLMIEKLMPENTEKINQCVRILEDAFKCYYARNDNLPMCAKAINGSYYDVVWKGLAAQAGFSEYACWEYDFGNACYNDRHYHLGYFVSAAAMLVHFRPEYATHKEFRTMLDTFIRDVTNPSEKDIYFPRFRTFDWFDWHSWSRGLYPSEDGKDQESASEELNMLYGLILWGRAINNTQIQTLGATMLALEVEAVKTYFLMTPNSPVAHHPADFVKNHVTGIFFQGRVRYTTWFGNNTEYIHGIQMLPLSPALQLTRSADFCQSEWNSLLKPILNNGNNSYAWNTLLLTGSLAWFAPNEAYSRLKDQLVFDDGLMRSYAFYWVAVQDGFTGSQGVSPFVIGGVILAALLIGGIVAWGCCREKSTAEDARKPIVELGA